MKNINISKLNADVISKPRVLFHHGNGVGMGHQLKCLNLALALKKVVAEAEFLFISESKNQALIKNKGFSIIKSPVVHGLKDQARSKYVGLISDVIISYKPNLYIQDYVPIKYTDNGAINGHYFKHVCLPSTKKVLICTIYNESYLMYKFNEVGLENVDLILLPYSINDFPEPEYSKEFREFITCDPKILLSGAITRTCDENEILSIKEKYKINDSDLTLLFAAGAGGNIKALHSFEANTFFKMVSKACIALSKIRQKNIKIIVVKGPYSETREKFLNAKVVTFEENMPALIKASSLAIFRPGYNMFNEVYFSKIPMIIVPSTDSMEAQHVIAKKAVDLGICEIAKMGDSKSLSNILIEIVKNKKILNNFRKNYLHVNEKSGNEVVIKAFIKLMKDK
ncbi:MAG: glycosyltransferase [Pseudomonadota bacterium]